MLNALLDVKNTRASIRKTAEAYGGIQYTTLHDHLPEKSKKRYGGPPTALSHEEEEIVQCCIVLQEMGFPVDRSSQTSVVSDYIKAT